MLEFEIGQKVTVTDTYLEYHVLKAKKGSVGVITEFTSDTLYKNGIPIKIDMVTIENTKGSSITCPLSYITPYKKRVVKTLKTMTNEELVEEYEDLILKEQRMPSMKTKSYSTVLDKMAKCKTEILNRLNEKA